MTRSLQGRLLVGTGIVITAGLIAAGIAVYAFSRSALYHEFDDSLRATVQAMSLLTEENEDGIQFEADDFGLEEFTRSERPSYYQIWHDGNVLARSSKLAGNNLSSEAGTMLHPKYSFVQLPDGRRGRQISVTFQPRFEYDAGDSYLDDDDLILAELEEFANDDLPSQPSTSIFTKNVLGTNTAEPDAVDGHDITLAADTGVVTLVWDKVDPAVTIVLARDTIGIEQPLETLRWVLFGVGFAVTGLSLGLLMVVVRRGLQPMKSVSEDISRIDANSLQSRISPAHVPQEIIPIVSRLNELLDRLGGAFHRERDFSSNIAHELRTPLAGLRSTLEVYLSRVHDQEEYETCLRACLKICQQSEHLVENLLSLGRLEGDKSQPSKKRFLLDELFYECWDQVRDVAERKELKTRFAITDNVEIHSDREMMRVILGNLIGNAISHSDRGGQVNVQISLHPKSVEITNTGNRLSADQLSHVFDRLWRGDDARAQTGVHSGLGLTLAHRCAELLGCSIDVSVDGETFCVSLALISED